MHKPLMHNSIIWNDLFNFGNCKVTQAVPNMGGEIMSEIVRWKSHTNYMLLPLICSCVYVYPIYYYLGQAYV